MPRDNINQSALLLKKMPRKTIQYHPDSSETETQSFIFIGIAILCCLAIVLLAFIIMDHGTLGIAEILVISFFVVVPVSLGVFALKGNKESMAYDRASQIVNYSEPLEMTIKSIETTTFDTTNSDNQEEIIGYLVVLTKNQDDYLCVVKKNSAPFDLRENNTNENVSAYLDPVSNEVVAFSLNNAVVWGIPSTVLKSKYKS